ncbi:MAG TPA: nitroreductase family protein, partial [Rhodothermales bacterium]
MSTANRVGDDAGGNQNTLASRFGRALARRLTRFWKPIDARLLRIAAKSERFSSIYFAFFSREFDREHRAVIAGRLLWQESRSGAPTTTSLLRRNTHRLEKGLLMRPRRGTFALDYIRETVDFYTSFVRTEKGRDENNGEVRWATDVLDEYFRVSAPNPLVDRLRTQYHQSDRPLTGGDGQPRSPYRRDLSVPPPVKYEDLLALAKRRRSVRWFLDKPVPRELIEKAVTVASLSPSACNRQPYLFRVFDDPKFVQTVAELPGGTVGFAHQFPAVIALVGELRNYYGERDRHLIY